MGKLRIYNQWSGNLKGVSEDLARCIVEVWPSRGLPYQCCRKRGHGADGLYCKQHAKRCPLPEVKEESGT